MWGAIFLLVITYLVFMGFSWLHEVVWSGREYRHERRMTQLRTRERELAARAEARKPPVPVCGCGHHLAMHDSEGRCHDPVRVPTGWDASGKPLGYEPRQCACQRYVGPRPLPQFYAEELTDEDRPPEGRPPQGLPPAG